MQVSILFGQLPAIEWFPGWGIFVNAVMSLKERGLVQHLAQRCTSASPGPPSIAPCTAREVGILTCSAECAAELARGSRLCKWHSQ